MNGGTLRGLPGKRIARVADAGKSLAGSGEFVEETAILYGAVANGSSPSTALGADGDLYRSTGQAGLGGGREWRKESGAWVRVTPYNNGYQVARTTGKAWATGTPANTDKGNGVHTITVPSSTATWADIFQTLTTATVSGNVITLSGDTLSGTYHGVIGFNLSFTIDTLPGSGTLNFGGGVAFGGNPAGYVSVTPAGSLSVVALGATIYTSPVTAAAGDTVNIAAHRGFTLFSHERTGTPVQQGFTFYASSFTSGTYWRDNGGQLKVSGQGALTWEFGELIVQ